MAGHADLINRNVLVGAHQINAVLDWGCSTCGAPLYDIAWLEHWAPWHPGLAAIDIRAEARRHHEALGLATSDFDRRIRCCALHIGLDHQAYNAWLQDEDALIAVVERTQHYIDGDRGARRHSQQTRSRPCGNGQAGSGMLNPCSTMASTTVTTTTCTTEAWPSTSPPSAPAGPLPPVSSGAAH